MTKDYEIVKEKIATIFIGKDGNWHHDTERSRYVLENKEGETISHQYACMISLGDDHFAVCNPISEVKFPLGDDYYDIIKGEYTTTSTLKWGIIRVNRDEKGLIIPGGETLVVPYLYDRISSNNSLTATAYNNDNLTYIELDQKRSNYGKQLVPCLLEQAVPFDIQIEGFAECTIDGINGYVPRNCIGISELNGEDLLTYEQVAEIKFYLAGEVKVISPETVRAYFKLTQFNLNEHPLMRQKRK